MGRENAVLIELKRQKATLDEQIEDAGKRILAIQDERNILVGMRELMSMCVRNALMN